jgi:hypothetical protein
MSFLALSWHLTHVHLFEMLAYVSYAKESGKLAGEELARPTVFGRK